MDTDGSFLAEERANAVSDPSSAHHRTTNEDDAALVERLRRDDGGALAALYDRYGRLAYSLAYRIVGKTADAEDVVQDSFLAFWRQADRFDPARGAVRSYLLTIVHRRAIDAMRSRSVRKERGLEDTGPLLATAGDPVELASLAEERELVRRALAELPPGQRLAIELTYFGGLTVAEMAERQQIPIGTAKSRLRLALERMRKTLGQGGRDEL